MKTYCQIMDELKNFSLKDRFFISDDEIREISGIIEIEGKTEEELRNMRNAVVIHFSRLADENASKVMETMNKMNAVCAVIDYRIFNMGCEV